MVVGEATDHEVFQHLAMIGGAEVGLLGRLEQTQLVQRAEPETRETRLLGYKGRFRINPALRDALSQVIVD
jgi:hypothetical protein